MAALPRVRAAVSVALFCLILGRVADAAILYNISDLGATLPAANEGKSVNSTGQAVVESNTSLFLYANGIVTSLPSLLGEGNSAHGNINQNGKTSINSSGQIAGLSAATHHAAIYTNGTLKDLGALGNSTSFAFGINDSGQVVGYSATSSGSPHAFVYSSGAMTDVGTLGGNSSKGYAINSTGQIVGSSSTSTNQTHAFSYQNGVMTDLGTLSGYTGYIQGPNASYATGINSAGTIVGYSVPNFGDTHSFVYTNGTMNDLGTLNDNGGGQNVYATGINSAGAIVGESVGRDFEAFVYANGAMTDLNTVIDPNSGWFLFGAQAINDGGQIVGYGSNP